MDLMVNSVSKNSKPMTPMKDRERSQSRIQETNNKLSENLNPNVSHSSPGVKPTSSPLTKSAKSQKSVTRNPNPVAYSPRNKLRDRKFVVAKKNSRKEKGGTSVSSTVECKCKERFGAGNAKKCLCVAYRNLRASQEEFFKSKSGLVEEKVESDDVKSSVIAESGEVGEETEKGSFVDQNLETEDGYGSVIQDPDGQSPEQEGTSTTKRRRDKLLEEARNSVPEFGKVLHLVKAFEKLLTMPKKEESDEKEDDKEIERIDSRKAALKWALPGLQPPPPPEVHETRESVSSLSPSDLILTAENLGLDSRASVSSSWDSSRGSITSRTSNGGRRSRRNSLESCGTMGGRRKKNQLKATSQKPFKLRTEQRGRQKEEEFMKKIQEMVQEEERLRIPLAQGLPWTTDEPECLMKPPVKENTRPIDLKLHSDLRAIERAEFDHQVAEKLTLIEQYRTERERQQKMEQEEEIRRLRKELIPKAQPMPYFDRPFIPRRSVKHPTIPKEPKFHMPHQKKIKCCLSWNDISSFTYQQ